MNDECVDFGRTADRIYINSEKAVTLSANGGGLEPRPACTCYAYNISPYQSNSMLSKNPRSGVQRIETTRTLDLMGANPNCNQGGR